MLDTSVFIALESGRALKLDAIPNEVAVSVITVAELRAGVLAASDDSARAKRLTTFERVLALSPLPVDVVAASHWAALRVALVKHGRRINVNDLWIASIALANDLPVVTQDADFDPLLEICDLGVVRV